MNLSFLFWVMVNMQELSPWWRLAKDRLDDHSDLVKDPIWNWTLLYEDLICYYNFFDGNGQYEVFLIYPLDICNNVR